MPHKQVSMYTTDASCWTYIFRRNCKGRFSNKTGRFVITIEAEYLSPFRFLLKKIWKPTIWFPIMLH